MDIDRLIKAIVDNNPESVSELIKAGVDVNRQCDKGGTALILAAGYCPKAVPELIKAGADVNKQNKDGKTALMYAAIYCPEVIPELIKAGADVNQRNKGGETALMIMARYQPKHVLTLIKAGADVNVKDETGQTAADYYRERTGEGLPSESSVKANEMGKNLLKEERQSLQKLYEDEEFLHSAQGLYVLGELYKKMTYNEAMKVYTSFQDHLDSGEKAPFRKIIRAKRAEKSNS